MTDEGQTQIVTFARNVDVILDARLHCLEVIEGLEPNRRYVVGRQGASIGRVAPADIVIADSEVSRTHCRLTLDGEAMTVTDLNSTNGTFIDGSRISEPTALPVGATLRVGRQLLKHAWLTQKEILQQDEFDREIRKASSYVHALLPAPVTEGAIRADWHFEPCSKLGGDAFGYGALSDTQFLIYLLDVSGHGAGAAMHSVAVMNTLKQKLLANTDMARPEQVLAALNAMFLMEDHAGMYFTLWYGVYDTVSRKLTYATAGHHPAFLVPKERDRAAALKTRNGLIGIDSDAVYGAASVDVPPGSSLYLFSDGVFEIVTIDGVEWRLGDFVPHIVEEPIPGLRESQRLYREVRRLARPGSLEDDFSLLVLSFD
jgi:serine phosphatase RsbU (regulator of sigma subunit)